MNNSNQVINDLVNNIVNYVIKGEYSQSHSKNLLVECHKYLNENQFKNYKPDMVIILEEFCIPELKKIISFLEK